MEVGLITLFNLRHCREATLDKGSATADTLVAAAGIKMKGRTETFDKALKTARVLKTYARF